MEQSEKRGRGRPPGRVYSERLTVRLSEEHRAMLIERALADRRAEAEMARVIIEKALEDGR